MIKVNSDPSSPLSQGDIFRDVEYIEFYEEVDGDIAVQKIIFPLVVLLTQSCDLL